MDTEINPIENESELVESSEPINENGCDDNEKPKVIDTVTQQSDDKETDQSIESENDQKHTDDSESSPMKSPANEPTILCASETEPYDIIDSDNPSENNSPEKNSSATIPATESDVETKQIEAEEVLSEIEVAKELPATECVATCDAPTPSIEMDEVDEPANTLQVDSSPEKSSSEMACLIPSPSDPMNDSVDEKNESWDQLNEPIDDVNYDDSDDDDDDDDDDNDDDSGADDEFSKTSNPKTVEQKANSDCQVFELTDDNSSVEDVRESDGEDDMDADEMNEEEEDDDDEDEPEPSGNHFIYQMNVVSI